MLVFTIIMTISHVMGDGGIVLTNRADNEKCFLDFYSRLWTSSISFSFQDLLLALLQDLNVTFDFDKINLNKPVSKVELDQTVFSL